MTALPSVVLGCREVHVWCLDPTQVTDLEVLRRGMEMLSPEERDRLGRFRVAEARHDYLVAHALVRLTLSRYAVDVDPGHWVFSHGSFGRPEIAGPRGAPPLRFNLSHTPGMIACGVTLERPLGVDVEEITRPLDAMRLANRFFSRAEAEALRGVPSGARVRRFFEIWTLKESYVKARGTGLSLSLDRFAFHLEDGGPVSVFFDPCFRDAERRWQFAVLHPTPRHVLAVAVERANGAEVSIRVRPSPLDRWPGSGSPPLTAPSS